jgi:hypothetical protein
MAIDVRKPERLPRGVKLVFGHSSGGTLLEFAMTRAEAIAYACEILDAAGIAKATLLQRGEVDEVAVMVGFDDDGRADVHTASGGR